MVVATRAPAALTWRAQPRQRDFLRRTEDEVLYGGAAGGGKTDALLIYGVKVAMEHTGANILFLRRTFADLNKLGAAIPRSHELLSGRAHWNGQEHKWTFANGSVLQFGHLQHEIDMYSYQGAQVDVLLWDELTQFTQVQYDFLTTRVRATVEGTTPTVRAATNPGGVGHGWVKARWITAAPWGQSFDLLAPETGEVTGRGVFIPAKLADNQALLERDPEYGTRLKRLPEGLRRAYLDGDWDVFPGQFFTEWRAVHPDTGTPYHVWPTAFARRFYDVPDDEAFPPAGWTRWAAVDGGVNDPWCVLWAARAPDKRTILYRERYGPGVQVNAQAAALRKIAADKGERWEPFLADPAMFNTRANLTVSDAQVYAQGGVALTKGTNAREPGWRRLREQLTTTLADGFPALVVLDGACPNLVRTLPDLVVHPLHPEDIADKQEDHAADCLRYLVMPAAAPEVTRRAIPLQARGVTVDYRTGISGVRSGW